MAGRLEKKVVSKKFSSVGAAGETVTDLGNAAPVQKFKTGWSERDKHLEWFLIFFCAIAFAVAYNQLMLYSVNQNTKFLHGLAKAGIGLLSEDWQANTTNGLPVFTFIVYFTARFLHVEFFYIFQAFLLSVYFISLYLITTRIIYKSSNWYTRTVIASILVIWHCIWVRSRIMSMFNWEGVAEQYILGDCFQPCVFGVFILLSVYCFLKDRHLFAALLLCVSAAFHPAYLLPAVILNTVYFITFVRSQETRKQALFIFAGAMILVMAYLVFINQLFSASTPEITEEARLILAYKRIPHHSLVGVWLKKCSTLVKFIAIFASIWLTRRYRLAWVIGAPLGVVIILTGIQYLTNHTGLALISPWRMTVFLVPLAYAVILAHVIRFVEEHILNPRSLKYVTLLFVLLMILAVGYGVKNQVDRAVFQKTKNPWIRVAAFLKSHSKSGQLYMTSVDLMDFRLATGMPQFVSWKSHPYKDIEVLEWYRRINLCKKAIKRKGNILDCVQIIRAHEHYGVTHVMIKTTRKKIPCAFLKVTYQDEHFTVLIIRKSNPWGLKTEVRAKRS